jgi:aryl-alcohol dehydrogenase-like predicted oxidoreductase
MTARPTMDRIRLGLTTELQVSPICFATWQLGGDWSGFDERDAAAAIRHALELGVNFIDTAHT